MSNVIPITHKHHSSVKGEQMELGTVDQTTFTDRARHTFTDMNTYLRTLGASMSSAAILQAIDYAKRYATAYVEPHVKSIIDSIDNMPGIELLNAAGFGKDGWSSHLALNEQGKKRLIEVIKSRARQQLLDRGMAALYMAPGIPDYIKNYAKLTMDFKKENIDAINTGIIMENFKNITSKLDELNKNIEILDDRMDVIDNPYTDADSKETHGGSNLYKRKKTINNYKFKRTYKKNKTKQQKKQNRSKKKKSKKKKSKNNI